VNGIVIFRKTDGTGEHHVKQKKPDAERQLLYALSQMLNVDP
jgi:hypothetical protein